MQLFDMEPVFQTEEYRTVLIDKKHHRVKYTRRIGRCLYITALGTQLASEATFIDWGEKLGVSECFTRLEPKEETELLRRIRPQLAEAGVLV